MSSSAGAGMWTTPCRDWMAMMGGHGMKPANEDIRPPAADITAAAVTLEELFVALLKGR